MSPEFHSFIQLLKEEIKSKLGRDVSYAKDCEELSELILDQTKRQVSPSTLKRFFGIVKSSFAPSKYTLDTLSVFLTFNDWQEFINHFEKEKHQHSQHETWENLKKRTDEITSKSLQTIHDKLGTRIQNFPYRKFADRRFDNFLNSSKVATAFVAPDGYGKTPIIVQIANRFFTGEQASYPNDILCLVDGSILYNLVTLHQKISRLYNLLEYDPKNSFSAIFREHPELVKGRFVLVIDGIDDIYPANGKTSQFIDNLLKVISTYENINWFKLLITCTPRVWRMFSERIIKNELLKSFWYNVNFLGRDESMINIPLLKKNEIAEILKKNQIPIQINELCFNNPGLSNIIKNPYLLHLYVISREINGNIRDLDLLYLYVKKMVLSPPYLNEKYSIWKLYFNLCANGDRCNEVMKKEMKLSSSKIMAYNELIRIGFLYEYSIIDEYLSLNTYVSFSHNILFAFYLANTILKENDSTINNLSDIVAAYQKAPNLQQLIVQYLVKILFKQRNIEILKDIFSLYPNEDWNEDQCLALMTSPKRELAHVVSDEFRRDPTIRKDLLPFYAQSKISRNLFFEYFFDVDHLVQFSGNELELYAKYNHSTNAELNFHFLKFLQYFLSDHFKECKNEVEHIKMCEVPESASPSNLIHFFTPIVIFQSVHEHSVSNNTLVEIYRIANQLRATGIQTRNDTPIFEFEIIFALHYGNMHQEILDLANFTFKNYDLTDSQSSIFYQLFLSVYASALLATGDEKKALGYYKQIKYKDLNFPSHIKYYIKIRLLLVKTEFLIYKGKHDKARKILKKTKTIAENLKFTYFLNQASSFEAKLNLR